MEKDFFSSLERWRLLAGVGKKPSTLKYHRELVNALARLWRSSAPLPALVDEITDDHLAEFSLRAGHYSATRWNAFVGVLRQLCPAARVLRKRRVPWVERKPPNQAEFARLLIECDKLPRSKVGLVIRFLAATGLRIGEAHALTWADVLEDRIEVPGRLTKNGRPRVIPLVNGLAEILERLRPLTPDRVLPKEGFRRGLAKACRAAGVRQLSPHDFRRLFATRCIESGVDVPTTARWLGHQDGGALLGRCYFHLLDGHSRAMAARVNVFAPGIVNNFSLPSPARDSVCAA